VFEITDLLNSLITIGHFSCNIPILKAEFKADSMTKLNDLYQTYQGYKILWNNKLSELRSSNQYINYFYSKQLWILLEFFQGVSPSFPLEDRQMAIEYLKFIDSSLDFESLDTFFGGNGVSITENSRRQALALLSFVDQDFTHDESFDSFDASDSISSLEKIAQHLEKIYQQDGVQSDCSEESEEEELNQLTATQFSYCIYEDDSCLIPLLFGIYDGMAMSRRQIFICEDSTESQNSIIVEEFAAFLMRALNSTQQGEIFAVINIHKLNLSIRSLFFRKIEDCKKMQNAVRSGNIMMILVRSDLRGYVEGMNSLKLTSGVSPLAHDKVSAIVQSKSKNVLVLNSVEPGMGKTERAIEICREERRLLMETVVISDRVTRKEMVKMLNGKDRSPHKCIHIDLSNIVNEDDVEIGLFELLFFGTAIIGTSIVHWSSESFCIVEVGDRKSSKVKIDAIKYFRTETITWHMNKYIVDADPSGDDQLVCNYLDRLAQQPPTLHELDIINPKLSKDQALAASTGRNFTADECRRLYDQYFFSKFVVGTDYPSINVFRVFLKLLANQLREFSASGFYIIEHIRWSGHDPKVRNTLVEHLVDSARDFATRSVNRAKVRQSLHASASANALDYDDYYSGGGIIRWDDQNQVMLVIANGSLTTLYRNIGNLNPDTRKWIENSRLVPSELPDYSELSSQVIRQILSKFCGLSEPFKEYPEYVLTGDNFLKIAMVLIRIQARLPVVIMGDAGVGENNYSYL
jgi:E3 ubiquitin-protein ligase RNF213